MYNELSIQDCLFVLQEADIQYFKQIAEIHESLVRQDSQHKANFWELVLNIFFVLENTEEVYILDPDKILLYSSNIYCLNLIENNKNVQSFLKVFPKSPHINFVLAYYLGIRLHHLVHELLEKSADGQIVKRNSQKVRYYRVHLNQTILKDNTHPFYKDQKVIVWNLSQSKITNLFQNIVENGLKSTREYLKEYLNENWSIIMHK